MPATLGFRAICSLLDWEIRVDMTDLLGAEPLTMSRPQRSSTSTYSKGDASGRPAEVVEMRGNAVAQARHMCQVRSARARRQGREVPQVRPPRRGGPGFAVA